ncbi:hypothetical protein HBN50_07030 [Halobacteriovorax sp. GB3]|uniref:hypothetical protein n=1 Tax=Halobacteriovorax sp. GB3 TaxID=2719615 RepID=UPI0023610B03|nr:hypothetical protein [Halobacteriovorax sp. GB3]MDD0852841.1 hypothetical protein [Halobacteriovorax sp. GB3]
MKQEFWLQAWEENNIGFHQSETNPLLLKYETHYFKRAKRVLVPLCGKSLDLLYLKDICQEVVGVEISKKAMQDFIDENNLKAIRSTRGPYECYQIDNLTLLCGDFFELSSFLEKSNQKPFDLIYDRASNVALPPEMRTLYYEHMKKLLSDEGQIFLVGLYQDVDLSFGPPFSISNEELFNGYGEHFQISELETNEYKANGRFKDAGIKKLKRTVYSIEMKKGP